MTTDADKVRFLAELAIGRCLDCRVAKSYQPAAMCNNHVRVDYPHSLDAIARDLLPILRERGLWHEMYWDSDGYAFYVRDGKASYQGIIGRGRHSTEPARAAFEAIFEALHGGGE